MKYSWNRHATVCKINCGYMGLCVPAFNGIILIKKLYNSIIRI